MVIIPHIFVRSSTYAGQVSDYSITSPSVTAYSGDIIVAIGLSDNNSPVTFSDIAGLEWIAQYSDLGGACLNHNYVSYVVVPSEVDSDTISFSQTTSGNRSLFVLVIAYAYTPSPFDDNPSLPSVATSSGTASTQYSTSYAIDYFEADLLIAIGTTCDFIAGSFGGDISFTQLDQDSLGDSDADSFLTSNVSDVTTTFGNNLSGEAGIIVFALTSTTHVPPTQQTLNQSITLGATTQSLFQSATVVYPRGFIYQTAVLKTTTKQALFQSAYLIIQQTINQLTILKITSTKTFDQSAFLIFVVRQYLSQATKIKTTKSPWLFQRAHLNNPSYQAMFVSSTLKKTSTKLLQSRGRIKTTSINYSLIQSSILRLYNLVSLSQTARMMSITTTMLHQRARLKVTRTQVIYSSVFLSNKTTRKLLQATYLYVTSSQHLDAASIFIYRFQRLLMQSTILSGTVTHTLGAMTNLILINRQQHLTSYVTVYNPAETTDKAIIWMFPEYVAHVVFRSLKPNEDI